MADALLLALGVLLLSVGGEILIRGSLAIALRFNVSRLLSGLVIVGFGTSAPELAVSVDAAIRGQPDIAVGNVVGSNIGNILLVLGSCALIAPLAVHPLALRRDAATVVAATMLFVLLGAGAFLGRTDAAILLAALLGYSAWAYWSERVHASPPGELHQQEAEELSAIPRSASSTGLALVAGLALLVGGSQALVAAAVGIADQLGFSEAFIGLTLVAVGTSLPELSIAVISAFRRHGDVAVGNILGSNIFNLLGILGVSALFQPLPLHARILHFDQWVMLATSLLLLLFLMTGRRLTRAEGGALLLGYGIYLAVSYSVFPG